ncbi:GlxA family transcriptional regulator [Streptomyces sp. RKAG337]|uniref:GlxA family transcriptional regulator n=1 Tax=Streptomyces sp. RKAG337 TaxID=2893404 RepID=UPI002033FDF4|nr:GlxA family transcriptional regulator [Streptomyces sp. RKAG337]MCM2424881.1 GlxA family transcriptional regulator [Streptomyces sp. RKAG337]
MRTRTVLIVLFEGMDALDVVSPIEILSAANLFADRTRAGSVAYRVRTASLGGTPVHSPSGLTLVPDTDLHTATTPHTLIVPGPHSGDGTTTVDPEVVSWLRQNAKRSQRIVSICTGAFLLAEAGLLTGKRVTTHWSQADELAQAYPGTEVDADPIFIRDGRISTSAGGTSGMDLMLALIEEDLGRDAALTLARHLVVFLRRPGTQRQFSTHLQAQLSDRQSLRDVQDWIAVHPDADLSVETLAQRANLSPRQFARAFTAETGTSPGRYVDQTRLETARRLLEDTQDSVEHIARVSGYPSTEAMRRAFHRALSISPAQYRQRF